MGHKEKEMKQDSSENTDTINHVCSSDAKKCSKNFNCFMYHCNCLKGLMKTLAFIMLLIITISVVKIALNDRDYDKHDRGYDYYYETKPFIIR